MTDSFDTQIWTVDPTGMPTLIFAQLTQPDTPEALEAALDAPAELLRNNHTVAFPTETVYGLGGSM